MFSISSLKTCQHNSSDTHQRTRVGEILQDLRDFGAKTSGIFGGSLCCWACLLLPNVRRGGKPRDVLRTAETQGLQMDRAVRNHTFNPLTQNQLI